MKRKAAMALGISAALLIMSSMNIIAGEAKEEEQGSVEQEVEEEAEEEEIQSPIEIEEDLPIEKGERIAVVAKTTKGSFWKAMEQGMKDALSYINERYGFENDDKLTMTYEGPDDEGNITDQINTIDAVLAENPGALCLAAIDKDSCQAQLETAKENGIPVVMFDSYVESDLYAAYCGTDNEKVSSMAAQQMAAEMGNKGKTVIFAHQSKTQTSVQRVEGFEKAIHEFPEMSVVQVLYSDQQEDMGSAMETFLEEHPDVQGVYCTNATVADLFLETAKKFEDRSFTFVGVDADKEQQKAVADGRELGIVAQQPYLMGFQTMYLAVKAMAKEDTQGPVQQVLLDTAWIDAQRLDDPSFAQYLDS